MSREKTYRNLAEKEISTLKANGCVCDDWSRITVKDGFNPDSCINVTFSGDVKLGVFTRENSDISGIEIRSGIYNARIHS